MPVYDLFYGLQRVQADIRVPQAVHFTCPKLTGRKERLKFRLVISHGECSSRVPSLVLTILFSFEGLKP